MQNKIECFDGLCYELISALSVFVETAHIYEKRYSFCNHRNSHRCDRNYRRIDNCRMISESLHKWIEMYHKKVPKWGFIIVKRNLNSSKEQHGSASIFVLSSFILISNQA
mmetsp:Transcript_4364/g.8392  ORF Transcript_4364/g.8392 Transcript_4364/m.8392 type:complete len:110 (+) Transcript_4364:1611-1940(+)